MIVEKNRIFSDVEAHTQLEIFNFIGNNLEILGFSNQSEIVKALTEREMKSSTGFVNGIAIPHGKVNIEDPIVTLIKVKDEINDWITMDDNKINFIICILVPNSIENKHLKILSEFSRKLVDSNFVSDMKNNIKDENYIKLFDFINDRKGV